MARQFFVKFPRYKNSGNKTAPSLLMPNIDEKNTGERMQIK
jgi:hypothetical protein